MVEGHRRSADFSAAERCDVRRRRGRGCLSRRRRALRYVRALRWRSATDRVWRARKSYAGRQLAVAGIAIDLQNSLEAVQVGDRPLRLPLCYIKKSITVRQ